MAKKKSKPTKEVAPAQANISTDTLNEMERFSVIPLIFAALILVVVVFAFVWGRINNQPAILDTSSSSAPDINSSSISNASPIISAPSQSASEESSSSGRVSEGISGSSTASSYTYAAAKGESVSKLSRKAINQYLTERGVTMSRAQRLFMEVNLTNANNPSFMEIGETRTFAVQQIADLFDQAQNLSSSGLMAWERQAASVGYR